MLYEVITLLPENLGRLRREEAVQVIAEGRPATQIRITSYNVCYTKLLRTPTGKFTVHNTVHDVY